MPSNLSTSLGLSDPRLRRFMQMSQLNETQYGDHLAIDKNGRLSVDAKSLTGSKDAVRVMAGVMAQMINDESSDIGLGQSDSVFRRLADALLGDRIDTLEDDVGDILDGLAEGTAVWGPEYSLSTLVGQKLRVFHTSSNGTTNGVDQRVYSTSHDIPLAGAALRGYGIIKLINWSENLSGNEDMDVYVGFVTYDSDGEVIRRYSARKAMDVTNSSLSSTYIDLAARGYVTSFDLPSSEVTYAEPYSVGVYAYRDNESITENTDYIEGEISEAYVRLEQLDTSGSELNNIINQL